MTSPVIGTPWKKLNAPVSEEAIEGVDKYWRAANYLSIGQIYLRSNPLMKEPFTREDVKHRLVGHWGTTPGLNFLIGHINRLIADHQQNTVIIMGPGHGGPAGTAQSYLDGTYTEYFPNITKDEAGLQKFFRQFSYPGGIPSHYAPETPGSIHEGGELGYALSHAYGAVMNLRILGQHLIDRHGMRHELRINIGLTHATCDQLGVLGSEIDNEHRTCSHNTLPLI